MGVDLLDIYDKMLKDNLKKNYPSTSLKKEYNKDEIVFEQKNTNTNITLNDPLAKFLFKLQNLKKNELKTKKQISEKKLVHEQVVEQKQEIIEEKQKILEIDPLEKFLLRLQNELSKKIEQKNKITCELEKIKTIDVVEVEQQKTETNPLSNNYIQELVKIDKNSKEKKLIKENEDLSNQILNLQTQLNRMKFEAGTWGGGDIGGGGSIRSSIDESVLNDIIQTINYVNSNSANWDSTSTLVQTNSADWSITEIDGGLV